MVVKSFEILTGTTTNTYSYATGPTGNDKTPNAGIDFSGCETKTTFPIVNRSCNIV